MTSPIDGFAAATPLTPPTYWYLNITGTAQGEAIGKVLEYGVAQGIINVGTTQINASGWTVQVNEATATTGDYIVIGTNSQGQLTELKLYNGASGKYNNPLFTSDFNLPGS